MNDVVEFTEENPGKIEITVSDRIYIKTNLSPGDLNLWIDRAKNMVVTGDAEPLPPE